MLRRRFAMPMLVALAAALALVVPSTAEAAKAKKVKPDYSVFITNDAQTIQPGGRAVYPVTVLPGWLQPFAYLSPATYVLDGARETLLNGLPTLSLWPYIWPLLLMGGIAIPCGLWAFKAAERYAKRTGKLHRNG